MYLWEPDKHERDKRSFVFTSLVDFSSHSLFSNLSRGFFYVVLEDIYVLVLYPCLSHAPHATRDISRDKSLLECLTGEKARCVREFQARPKGSLEKWPPHCAKFLRLKREARRLPAFSCVHLRSYLPSSLNINISLHPLGLKTQPITSLWKPEP